MHTNEYEKALQWAELALASKIVSYQSVVETPWSVVYKIETPQSVVYLKQVPELSDPHEITKHEQALVQ